MKKFLIILYIIIFVALTYYVVTLFINRDFKQTNTSTDTPKTHVQPPNPVTPDIKKDTPTDKNVENISKNAKYEITQKQCNSNCDIIINEDKKNYCLQICGLATPQTNITCDDITGLKKDYCLRDHAIKEKDVDACSDIIDSGITKQCVNRINEDIIDDIM